MANKNGKVNMQYYLIPDYTMKCRLYPNKTAAKAIDDAIHAIHVFYNCTLYEMQHNHLCTKEEKNKDKGQKKIVSIKKYGIFDVQTNQLIDDAKGFYYHKIGKANSIIKHHDSSSGLDRLLKLCSAISGSAIYGKWFNTT